MQALNQNEQTAMSASHAASAYTSRDIDLAHLARQTAGDRGLEREILALFRDQCGRMLGVIAQARGEGGGIEPSGMTAAHTLIGAALGVGANRVAEAARALEKAQVEDVERAYLALQSAAQDARALIDRLLAGR